MDVVEPEQPEAPEARPEAGEPDEPKRSANWLDLVIAVAILWSIELLLAVVLLALAGGPDLSTIPLGLLAASLLSATVTFVVSWVFVCKRYGKPLAEGFAIAGVPRRTIAWSLALGVAGAVAAALLMGLMPEGDSLMTKLGRTPTGLVVLVTIAIALPPFEEIYYRGFIFPVLSRHLGGVAAILIVAGWFGAAHVGQLTGDWLGIPIVFTMGIIWTVQRHRTGSLVPSIVCHWTYNVCLIAMSMVSMLREIV